MLGLVHAWLRPADRECKRTGFWFEPVFRLCFELIHRCIRADAQLMQQKITGSAHAGSVFLAPYALSQSSSMWVHPEKATNSWPEWHRLYTCPTGCNATMLHHDACLQRYLHMWRLWADLTNHAHRYLMLHGPTVVVSDLTSKMLIKQLHKLVPEQQGVCFHQKGFEKVQMLVLPDGELNELAVLLNQLCQLLLIGQLICILLQMKSHPCAALQRLSTVILLHLQGPGSSYQRSHTIIFWFRNIQHNDDCNDQNVGKYHSALELPLTLWRHLIWRSKTADLCQSNFATNKQWHEFLPGTILHVSIGLHAMK